MLEGRDVGLRIDALGYDFLRYDGRNERWEMVTEDPLLRERLFPDGMSAGLWLESRRVQLPERSPPSEDTPALPQILVLASGDVVPFEVRLERAGTEEIRAIAGHADGKIEIVANDENARR